MVSHRASTVPGGQNPGSGAVCEIDNHQGHKGTLRKGLRLDDFVILRVLGGSRFSGGIAKQNPGAQNEVQ
jgi:hypothetical protein